MLYSPEVIKNLIKQHYETLAQKTAEQFADSPFQGMETLARQTLQRMDEEKIVNQFEIIARFHTSGTKGE